MISIITANLANDVFSSDNSPNSISNLANEDVVVFIGVAGASALSSMVGTLDTDVGVA